MTHIQEQKVGGYLIFEGEERYVDMKAFTSFDVCPTHHAPLEITALADPGYISSTLTDAPDANRYLRIRAINGGLLVKGLQKNVYVQGDTTSVGGVIKIVISTKNASWTQATAWTLIIDITTGSVTGQFTIYCPPFNLGAYEEIRFFVTDDGATYYSRERCGFNDFMCGSVAAEEMTTNNLTAGVNVVCNVVSTTGFYVGSKVFVSDSENSEWGRIKSIITDTSITIISLSNSYTTEHSSKLEMVVTTRTAIISVVHRNVGKFFRLPAGVKSGVTLQFGIPHHIDKTEPLKLGLQYLSKSANAAEQVIKLRLQYDCIKYMGSYPVSNQFGTLKYTTFTPGVTADINAVVSLPEIPVSDWVEDGYPKNAHAMQVVRLGNDSEDTYTGDIDIVAILYLMKSDRLGGAEALFG